MSAPQYIHCIPISPCQYGDLSLLLLRRLFLGSIIFCLPRLLFFCFLEYASLLLSFGNFSEPFRTQTFASSGVPFSLSLSLSEDILLMKTTGACAETDESETGASTTTAGNSSSTALNSHKPFNRTNNRSAGVKRETTVRSGEGTLERDLSCFLLLFSTKRKE